MKNVSANVLLFKCKVDQCFPNAFSTYISTDKVNEFWAPPDIKRLNGHHSKNEIELSI